MQTIYPIDLADDVTLPNRRVVHVRALRDGDERPVRELYGHLSARSRYHRFLSPMPALPDTLLRNLVSVDYSRRLAMIAEMDTVGGAVVALGSFGAIDDGRAEVGLVVRDDWQGQGIGVAVAARVLRAAQARGFQRFLAHVLWENSAVRRLLDHVGEVVSTTSTQGVCELTFVPRRLG